MNAVLSETNRIHKTWIPSVVRHWHLAVHRWSIQAFLHWKISSSWELLVNPMQRHLAAVVGGKQTHQDARHLVWWLKAGGTEDLVRYEGYQTKTLRSVLFAYPLSYSLILPHLITVIVTVRKDNVYETQSSVCQFGAAWKLNGLNLKPPKWSRRKCRLFWLI